jgi:hypothetical protein
MLCNSMSLQWHIFRLLGNKCSNSGISKTIVVQQWTLNTEFSYPRTKNNTYRHTDTEKHGRIHNLYSSPNIVRMIKSGNILWAGYLARMGEKIKAYKILFGSLKWGWNSAETIIIKWTLGKCVSRMWIEFIWLRLRTGEALLWTR